MNTLPIALVSFAAAAAASDAARISLREINPLLQNIQRVKFDGMVIPSVDDLALELVKWNPDIVPLHKAQAIAQRCMELLPLLSDLIFAIGEPTFFYQREQDLNAAIAGGEVRAEPAPAPPAAAPAAPVENDRFRNLRRKGPPVYADTPQPLKAPKPKTDALPLGKGVLNEDEQS